MLLMYELFSGTTPAKDILSNFYKIYFNNEVHMYYVAF